MMKNKKTSVSVTDIVNESERQLKTIEKVVEKKVDPIRKNAFRRFPTLFLLMTTFGVAAIFYGFEVILGKSKILINYPWLIVLIGVAVLYGTGKLYHKLD